MSSGVVFGDIGVRRGKKKGYRPGAPLLACVAPAAGAAEQRVPAPK